MTVKQLLDVIDKKTMVEVRGEHDCELIFSTNRNCGYYTKDTFEKIKEIQSHRLLHSKKI